MLDNEVLKMCELAMRKVKADLHVMAQAIETNNGKLLLAASLDMATGAEFFAESIVTRMMTDEEIIAIDFDMENSAENVMTEYTAAIRAVDPVLADQWESIV